MKKLLLSLFLLIVLIGCNQKEDSLTNIKYIRYEDTIEKNEKLYKKGDEIPYTGLIKNFYPNQNIMTESNFKDGELDGIYKSYYESGQLMIECNFNNGKRAGVYKEFFENGKLMFKGNYKNDKLDGISEEFNEQGGLTEQILYDNGMVQKQIK